MQLKFGDILPSLACRAWDPKDQRLVDRFAGSIANFCEQSTSGVGEAPGQSTERRASRWSRDADHRNCSRRRAGGKREYGVTRIGQGPALETVNRNSYYEF
jgi:hypothetical protein